MNRCPTCGIEHALDLVAGPCSRCASREAVGVAGGLYADLDTEDPDATGLHIRQPSSSDVTGEWSGPPVGPTGSFAGPSATASSPPDAVARVFGDYEIRRELGRGGMGVVYEARQISLNRLVALKLIKAGLLADDAELRRFRNEAEAVALLDHPGIVSAYEVGEHAGQQYLAMKLVVSDGLAPLTERYRDAPRAAAKLVAEAADAVAHAHSRGILHRDLKPANILVDTDGRPHITDFGLAKRLEDDAEMTASGAILGTPAYMAPEQASGQRGGITTATDVYGLGGVLYSLLTGQAPFHGGTVIETLDSLRTVAPEPPMRLNARVPRDLQTICLKCLEKDPRRRYASALALADDLRAWLDSRPISARPVGPAERAWLWCRRKPTIAALSAAVIALIVGGAATTIAMQRNANRALLAKNQELTFAYGREATANADLAAANERVEQRYRLAMDAIKTFHTGASQDFLLKEPQFQALRGKLLNSAREFYDKLGRVLEASDDATSKRALLGSEFELAQLLLTLGRGGDALALHRQVLAGRESLAGEPGASTQDGIQVGRSLRATASLMQKEGPKADVPAMLARAVAFHERLAADHPDDPAVQDALAEVLIVLGDQLKNVDGNRTEAERAFRRSLTIWQGLAQTHPQELKYRSSQSGALSYLSFLRADEGKYDETIELYQQVVDLAREELERSPRDLRLRANLAACQSLMSSWYYWARRFGEAVEPARASLNEYREIAAALPGVPRYQHDLATSHSALGMVLSQTNQLAEAETEYRATLGILDKLALDTPDDRVLLHTISNARDVLSDVLTRLNRPAEAEPELRAALAIQTRLSESDPANHDLSDSLALSHLNLGRSLLGVDKTAGAESEFREAIAILARIAREHPAMAIYRQRLAVTHQFLGALLTKEGRLADAEAELRTEVAIFRDLAETDPDTPWVREQLASDLANLADVVRELGRPTEARDGYDQAVSLLDRLIEQTPETSSYRGQRARALRRRALARLDMGDPTGAAADTRKALDHWNSRPTRTGEEWFQTACCQASMAALAERDNLNAPVDVAETAMQSLSQAVALGHRDPRLFLSETALDALRNRPDFLRLLTDLAMAADPLAP